MKNTHWTKEWDESLLRLIEACRKNTQIDWEQIARLMKRAGFESGDPTEEDHDRLYRERLRGRYRRLKTKKEKEVHRQRKDDDLFEEHF